MVSPNYQQFPLSINAILDSGVNWAETYYVVAGDTLVASTWAVPTGLTSTDESFNTTGTTVRLQFTDPDTVAIGSTYEVTNHITTAAGLEDDQSFVIVCVQE